MTKFLLIGVAAILATPALADITNKIEFTKDGEHFVAQVHDDAAGRHVEGRSTTTGASFSLLVARGQVSGTYAGTSVDFAQPLTAETASR